MSNKHERGALAHAMANAGVEAKPEATAPEIEAMQAAAAATMAASADDNGVEDGAAVGELADDVHPLRKLITGYRIEDALAANLTERKPKRKGDPHVRSRRLARVYWKIGGDDCPYWLGSPSVINAITETFPDGSVRKRITIGTPGAMVGDDTWYPSLALNGQRNAADPEMRKLVEEVRREWIAAREAAVKAGTAAMATKATKPDQVGAADLAALGLSDFDAVETDATAAK